MMKQQLVWQDMSEAPKDRQIIVGIKSHCNDIIRLDVVEWDLILNDRREIDDDWQGFEWFSPGESQHYNSSDFIGWIEVPVLQPVLPQAK